MRALTAVLFAFALLLSIAGSAWANCGGEHGNTAEPTTTTKPLPQT